MYIVYIMYTPLVYNSIYKYQAIVSLKLKHISLATGGYHAIDLK
jgi:hypothetical protein